MDDTKSHEKNAFVFLSRILFVFQDESSDYFFCVFRCVFCVPIFRVHWERLFFLSLLINCDRNMKLISPDIDLIMNIYEKKSLYINY